MAIEKTKRITSIGGSALIEGIMMRGPKRTTVAVRVKENEIYTEDLAFKSLAGRFKIFRVPFIRGLGGLIDSMRLSFKALSISAEKAMEDVPQEEPSRFEKWIDKVFGDSFMKVLMVVATIWVLRLPLGYFLFSQPGFLIRLQRIFFRLYTMLWFTAVCLKGS